VLRQQRFRLIWLRAIAAWNPFSWAVDAARALFAGHPADPDVWKALLIVTALAVVASVWSARRFATSVR
jgi:ABC-2 type transport system permease protein